MKAIEFDEHTVKIAEHQPEYQTLPALQGQDQYGPYLVFCFELDEAERKQVAETGLIYWKQITGGQQMQPIGMSCLKEHNVPVPEKKQCSVVHALKRISGITQCPECGIDLGGTKEEPYNRSPINGPGSAISGN